MKRFHIKTPVFWCSLWKAEVLTVVPTWQELMNMQPSLNFQPASHLSPLSSSVMLAIFQHCGLQGCTSRLSNGKAMDLLFLGMRQHSPVLYI